ncbi:MAG: hypothetical protein QW165_00030 [Candidatus Woesearchaeota archaeon]
MVQKLGFLLLGFVALIALSGLIIQIQNSVTGEYYASGGGRWYYGPQRAQMQPDEACMFAGMKPVYPQQVYTNEWGTLMAVCDAGGRMVGVPLTQTILVR